MSAKEGGFSASARSGGQRGESGDMRAERVSGCVDEEGRDGGEV